MAIREYCPSRRYYISDVLSQEVLYEQGTYRRVKRRLKGWQPERGILTRGWTGEETIEEKDIISPIGWFEVEEKNNEGNG